MRNRAISNKELDPETDTRGMTQARLGVSRLDCVHRPGGEQEEEAQDKSTIVKTDRILQSIMGFRVIRAIKSSIPLSPFYCRRSLF